MVMTQFEKRFVNRQKKAERRKAVCEAARVLRPRGYFLWFDLAFPKFIKNLFQPIVKNYGLYTIDEIKLEFIRNEFEVVYYDHQYHGLFEHHNLVLQNRKVIS
jgi:uncharacterized protein (DUF1810 family)